MNNEDNQEIIRKRCTMCSKVISGLNARQVEHNFQVHLITHQNLNEELNPSAKTEGDALNSKRIK